MRTHRWPLGLVSEISYFDFLSFLRISDGARCRALDFTTSKMKIPPRLTPTKIDRMKKEVHAPGLVLAKIRGVNAVVVEMSGARGTAASRRKTSLARVCSR